MYTEVILKRNKHPLIYIVYDKIKYIVITNSEKFNIISFN